MSCSNFFSNVAKRVASRDLMASLECESWTTLQMIVRSSSLTGVLFDTDEVLPLTAVFPIAINTDSKRSKFTVERILPNDVFTKRTLILLSLLCRYGFPCINLCIITRRDIVKWTRIFLLPSSTANHIFPHYWLLHGWLFWLICKTNFTNRKCRKTFSNSNGIQKPTNRRFTVDSLVLKNILERLLI